MPFQEGNQLWRNRASNKRHGMCGSRIYQIWADMKHRCNNPHNACYPRYGGRGISYCPEWSEFMPFYEWATKNGYREDLTLDRVNNDGNYSPDNCKWSTQHEQSINKKHTMSRSGCCGVRKHGRGYAAEITWRRKYYYVGTFDTIEEAAKARADFRSALT